MRIPHPQTLVVFSLAILLGAESRAGVNVLKASVVSRVSPSGAPFEPGVLGFAASTNGRFLLFTSAASNVLPGIDPDIEQQIWLRDTKTGATRLVSHDIAGDPADSWCSSPSVSDDGRRVAFLTGSASFGFDPGGKRQVCIADLDAGTVRLCSKSTLQAPAIDDCSPPRISGDGRFVVFSSDAGNLKPLVPDGPQIFVYDVAADSLGFASVSATDVFANGGCFSPVVSRTGRYVTFISTATNLPTDGASNSFKVILRDRQAETTELVSVSADGTVTDASCNGHAMTPNGRWVAFFSSTPGLVPGSVAFEYAGYVVDRKKHTIRRFETGFDPSLNESTLVTSVSDNARRIAISTSFVPGGAVIPQNHGHVYDRKKHRHLLVATTDEPSAGANEDISLLNLRGDGKCVWFLSSDAKFDLLGSLQDQVLRLNLKKW